ncbi:hypothetical protein C8Q76DRAFT_794675 [Earliella scabrosa]|nr:hypothetical protein C8Q76DRAFT_794675 [Earliella scabrosa]
MDSDISVENAELIGLWFQILATGAYLTYFWRCIGTLMETRERASSVRLLVVCILIFLCTIGELVLALVRTYQAFGVHDGRQPDPTAFYMDPTTQLSLGKNSFNVVLTLISDIIIVYRTFVVWNFNWIVIVVPICFIVANLALGVLTLVALASAKGVDDIILATVSVRFKYYLILTFCMNVICAGLICWKIWRINAKVSRVIPSASQHVLEVIMETAGIYCAHLLALIITNCVGTNVFFILLDPLPPMAAIIFSMMIVRVRQSRPSQFSTTSGSSSIPPRFWRNTASHSRAPAPIDVEIDLERIVHTDSGSLHHGTVGDYSSHDKASFST